MGTHGIIFTYDVIQFAAGTTFKSRNARSGKNGESSKKSPESCTKCKWDGKRSPLNSDYFDKNGKKWPGVWRTIQLKCTEGPLLK